MKAVRRLTAVPHPFLKWVGGKRQLLEELHARLRETGGFRRYHEPFLGGGALFFSLYRAQELPRSKAFLSDNNPNLISTYEVVQSQVEPLIVLLKQHKEVHCKEYYYEVRSSVPEDVVAQAARMIYLNKTCFNGLYRENSKGLFNVPMGRYKNPNICDEVNLRAAAIALSRARLMRQPFTNILKTAQTGDFVYFDPPYHPVSKTASFTRYEKNDFGEAQQRELAQVFLALTQRGVKALLSNSMTPLIRELYDEPQYTFEEVLAARHVNSRADQRGKVSEALVRNF